MKFFKKLFSFSRKIRVQLDRSSRVELFNTLVPAQKFWSQYELDTAMGMAKWAVEGVNLNDLGNRARIFSRYLAQSDDHEEAISALEYFIEEVRSWEHMEWFLRRDIITDAFVEFWEPKIGCFVGDYLEDKYEIDDELFAQIELYDKSPEIAKEQMYADPNVDTETMDKLIKDLELFRRKAQFYAEHEEYLKMMDELADRLLYGEPPASAG